MSARRTATSSFGVGKRESHDSSAFYARFTAPTLSDDDAIGPKPDLDDPCVLGDARKMDELADNSVALVVTSPPYFVGKEYEDAVAQAAKAADGQIPETYAEYLTLLHDVFAECLRVLEPGGRIAVNVANLGRKPYRSLSSDIVAILEDLGMLLRGEILWQKGKGTSGSCAWGSFKSPANPVLRDTTERVIVASKGRFDRALSSAKRREAGLPWRATISNDEFLSSTVDVWELAAESAKRVNHPAPFPMELPQKLIDLYTYEGDAVLDPFMGSGSTLVAAARSGRIPVGYDIDPDYVAMARERLDDTEPRPPQPEIDDGLRAQDVAAEALRGAGFEILKGGGRRDLAKVGSTGMTFPFLVADRTGRRFYVEVPGGFTTSRPGLNRAEQIWKLLGQTHVVRASDHAHPVLVLAADLPRRRSEGDRLLRSVGPDGLFDLIRLYDDDDRARLARYGDGGPGEPGFWTEADLAAVGTATVPAKPAAKKPTEKKPAVRKPAAKKQARKKPAAKKQTKRRTSKGAG